MRSARLLFFGLITLFVVVPTYAATDIVTVRTLPLSDLIFQVEQSVPAEVVNDERSVLSAQIQGEVDEILVRVGEAVEKSQPLVQLDCRDKSLIVQQQVARLSALDARLTLARAQLRRVETLLKQRNASEELRDQRRAELLALRADRAAVIAAKARAELEVSYCVVVAPFTGVVTERHISQGSLAVVGSRLISVLSDAGREVTARIASDHLASIRKSTDPFFVLGKQRFPVSLRAVLPEISSATRTQEVRFSFTDTRALTGVSGRLMWTAATQQIPGQYAVKRNGVLGLMLWKAGHAEFLPLPDALEGQALSITLPLDTQVIVEGQHSVQSGEKVERREQADAATTAE